MSWLIKMSIFNNIPRKGLQLRLIKKIISFKLKRNTRLNLILLKLMNKMMLINLNKISKICNLLWQNKLKQDKKIKTFLLKYKFNNNRIKSKIVSKIKQISQNNKLIKSSYKLKWHIKWWLIQQINKNQIIKWIKKLEIRKLFKDLFKILENYRLP